MLRYFILLVFISVSSCVKLDSFLFGPEKLDVYLFEDYKGETELPDLNDIYGDDTIDNRAQLSVQSGGDTLTAHYLTHTNMIGSNKTILYCHGKGPNMDYYWTRIKFLYQTGADVFAFDYSGYGMSSGEISESKLYENVVAIAKYLRDDLSVPMSNVMIYGYSLGSVPAVYLASRPEFSMLTSLVLESPIGSVELFVQGASLLPFDKDYFMDVNMDNIDTIKSVHIPLLWMHGDMDGTIKWDDQGLTLFNNHPGSEGTDKFKEVVADGEHRTVPKIWGYNNYLNAISNFINGKKPF